MKEAGGDVMGDWLQEFWLWTEKNPGRCLQTHPALWSGKQGTPSIEGVKAGGGGRGGAGGGEGVKGG